LGNLEKKRNAKKAPGPTQEKHKEEKKIRWETPVRGGLYWRIHRGKRLLVGVQE